MFLSRMGLFLSKLYEVFSQLSGNKRAKILMLGLDDAGKSTILNKIKFRGNVCTVPTIGFNVETVSPVKGIDFTVWDVCGQDQIRSLWRHYYQNTEGLIFVVDSNDSERIMEAQEELYGIIDSDEMRHVPIVVLANKQDLPNSMNTAEVADRLALHKLTGRKWLIKGASAINGDGIYSGMCEMAEMIEDLKKNCYGYKKT